MVQPLQQGVERQGGHAGGRQLDRERQPVQPVADGFDAGTVAGREVEPLVPGARMLGEQPNGVVGLQRGERVKVFAGEPEARPAGAQDREPWMLGEDLREDRSGWQEMLHVVEHQEQAFVLEERPQPIVER